MMITETKRRSPIPFGIVFDVKVNIPRLDLTMVPSLLKGDMIELRIIAHGVECCCEFSRNQKEIHRANIFEGKKDKGAVFFEPYGARTNNFE